MKFRYEVIAEAMRLQGISYAKLEELSGTPASTIKKLVRGESEDPRLSTMYSVFNVLGLSIDRACGLAPERDIAKEAATHNVTMVTALQERLSMQDNKLSSIREELTDCKAEIASQKATIEARNASVAHRDTIIKSKDKWIAILAGVVILILAMDLLFANAGWLNFGLIK